MSGRSLSAAQRARRTAFPALGGAGRGRRAALVVWLLLPAAACAGGAGDPSGGPAEEVGPEQDGPVSPDPDTSADDGAGDGALPGDPDGHGGEPPADADLDAGDLDGESGAPEDPWRPRFHFSPLVGWQSDPNGLVFADGEYHLFFQHYPDLPIWGPMHWGHAVSTDLVRWEHLPIAQAPDPVLGSAFSGSAVVVREGAETLCGASRGPGAPCLAALFTHHGGREGGEKQSLALSGDRGRSWSLYPGSPVLRAPPGVTDFRDPKVFWHADSGRWVMVLAAGDHAELYGSQDLVRWEILSNFSTAGLDADRGLWECPDLIELPVAGSDPPDSRWILVWGLNHGASDPRPDTHYVIGRFDGERFVAEGQGARLVDHGADFYAVQSWSDAPDDRRLWIAWLDHWAYALSTPTAGAWRGAMTVPRELSLSERGGVVELVQRPVAELDRQRGAPLVELADESLTAGETGVDAGRGSSLDIELVVEPQRAAQVELRVRAGAAGEVTRVGYDVARQEIYLDRSASGRAPPQPGFEARFTAPLALGDGPLDLRVLVDRSSVEVFADGGRVVISALVFPSLASDGVSLHAAGGTAHVVSLRVHPMGSAW